MFFINNYIDIFAMPCNVMLRNKKLLEMISKSSPHIVHCSKGNRQICKYNLNSYKTKSLPYKSCLYKELT